MKRCIIALACLLLLTGCWDERQFKNMKLVLSMGLDKGEEQEIRQTVSIPTVERGLDGPGAEKVQIISTDAHTPRDGRDKIDQMISESFDPSKLRVIVLGEELAKENMYPVLDELYRNPNSNLNAALVIADGTTAEGILNVKNENEMRISNYLSGIIEAGVAATHTTGENLQMLNAEILEPGVDFSVPTMAVDENRQLLIITGMGLFHGKHYTGKKIDSSLTVLYMLLEGKMGNVARLTEKISDGEDDDLLNYVTVHVLKNDRKMKIDVVDGEVKVKINLNLSVKIVEYPSDHLYVKGKIGMVEKELEKVLTEKSKDIISTIQEANSDVLGIGRRVRAYHNKDWKKLNWEEEYPKITIEPHINVKVVQHGIIN
ncbi:Ger(x)C family spore germination protein [Bacillus sp. SB49]|uniref:Ger(x)C family spore germination protein n=1 Tax=Bacillaceae TaxID=186817 RepID=UPI0002A4E9C0|nr:MULTISPECIES: Ger(x)C family spore germination protein [Bacillaceae]ELK47582.1 spore germination protein [Halobacillus sp. BAB-2008]QHT45897.1 Ger(x)C family spore germination protein [Bacillus sp. SB49]